MAGDGGFEPPILDSESSVIPFHQSPRTVSVWTAPWKAPLVITQKLVCVAFPVWLFALFGNGKRGFGEARRIGYVTFK